MKGELTYSISDVAELLGVGTLRIGTFVAEGVLRAVNTGEGRRIYGRDVESLLTYWRSTEGIRDALGSIGLSRDGYVGSFRRDPVLRGYLEDYRGLKRVRKSDLEKFMSRVREISARKTNKVETELKDRKERCARLARGLKKTVRGQDPQTAIRTLSIIEKGLGKIYMDAGLGKEYRQIASED